MNRKGAIIFTFLVGIFPVVSFAKDGSSSRSVHVFVALCDNKNQGIVPVLEHLGRGDDPVGNLYWGARFGVKTFLRNSREWRMISCNSGPDASVLERCIFRYATEAVYLTADAYNGKEIRRTINDFLESLRAGTETA
ncbi:hypothetical protein L0156_20360 [bacterium]|nr:hypothetical protein [bacterium]